MWFWAGRDVLTSLHGLKGLCSLNWTKNRTVHTGSQCVCHAAGLTFYLGNGQSWLGNLMMEALDSFSTLGPRAHSEATQGILSLMRIQVGGRGVEKR